MHGPVPRAESAPMEKTAHPWKRGAKARGIRF
jgi:hypothetical protein